MSVRPVQFNPDGSIDVVYDELGHSGTIPAAEIIWTSDPISGNHNHNFIVLACPDGCGSASTHPVGGGAAPVEVQQLFVAKTEREGCACGDVEPSSTAVPESHVRLNCSRMDGPGRWQATQPPQVEALAGQQPQAPIVYRRTDRLVVGEHPRGGVGANHGVAVVDIAEYELLLRTDPAYVTQDNRIVGSPP
jgi:hypothetical protein